MIKYKIVITTGDHDGIGLEVAAKALQSIKPTKSVQYILWRSPRADTKLLKLIDKRWSRVTVGDLESALRIDRFNLVDIASSKSPAHWVEESARASMEGKISAMATGPLSKVSIKKSGLHDLGHTEILKRVSGAKNVQMAFIGRKFNVVLATDHLALSMVSKSLTAEKIIGAIDNTKILSLLLPKKFRSKPIGILGLNPHAGEDGLIGNEEGFWTEEIRKYGKKQKIPLEVPLVPDAAFLKPNWDKYSVFISLYHDQGLIPFKMIHGQDSGVHLTLGIPFIRTSVDHGTAKNIAGKNIANPNSMLDAIRWALKLSRLKS